MFVYSPEEEEVFFDQINEVYILTEADKFDEAEALLLQVNASVQDPKEECSIGAIMLDSIYAFYEQAGKVEKALPYFLKETDYLKEKMENAEINNPVHFVTTGAIYYAMSNLHEAREYFKTGLHLGGEEVFEELSPEYLLIATADDHAFAAFSENFVPNLDAVQENLTEEQQELVDQLCDQGNEAMDAENYENAINLFLQAMAVLPEPKADWEAAGWISASLGDVYFSTGDYANALKQLLIAEEIYSRNEVNAFVLLRLGETYFELGDLKSASKYLLKAYKMEGAELFEEDKKYLNFLKKEKKI